MKFLLLIWILTIISCASGQVASFFSKMNRTKECGVWTEWGECIWTNPISERTRSYLGTYTNTYLDQLDPYCQKHWFYNMVRKKWGIAVNNVFNYIKNVVEETEPCGMCSYRQSCGFAGKKLCHKPPYSANRDEMPFMVSEQVCTTRHGLVRSQIKACHTNPKLLKRNGGICQVWPSDIPRLIGVSENLQNLFKGLTSDWARCIPQYKYRLQVRNGRKRWKLTDEIESCRCCCAPYEPNPLSFKCEKT